MPQTVTCASRNRTDLQRIDLLRWRAWAIAQLGPSITTSAAMGGCENHHLQCKMAMPKRSIKEAFMRNPRAPTLRLGFVVGPAAGLAGVALASVLGSEIHKTPARRPAVIIAAIARFTVIPRAEYSGQDCFPNR